MNKQSKQEVTVLFGWLDQGEMGLLLCNVGKRVYLLYRRSPRASLHVTMPLLKSMENYNPIQARLLTAQMFQKGRFGSPYQVKN